MKTTDEIMELASHKAGKYVCECESWTPGDES